LDCHCRVGLLFWNDLDIHNQQLSFAHLHFNTPLALGLSQFSQHTQEYIVHDRHMEGPSQQQLIWMVIGGTAVLLILAVGVVSFFFLYQSRLIKEKMKNKSMENHYQREMVNAIIKSQETERKKIAADIHDNLNGSLYIVQLLMLKVKESLFAQGVTEFDEQLGNSIRLLEQSIDSTKQIARDLVPVSLTIAGLGGSLRDYCNRIKLPGLKIVFEESGIAGSVSYNRQLNVYRVLQELLSNSVKHAGSTQINISLRWGLSKLQVDYSNDGKDFVMPQELSIESKGLGILNIFGRLDILGAKIIDRGNEKGFKFIFELPYE
jgi:signal transduction histidine kinase